MDRGTKWSVSVIMTHSKRKSRKKGPMLLAGEKCVGSNSSVTVGSATMLTADVAPGA